MKYNWSKVPKDVDHVVTNEEGEVWGFYYPPEKDLGEKGWKNPPRNGLALEPPVLLNLEPFKGNWEDSEEPRLTT